MKLSNFFIVLITSLSFSVHAQLDSHVHLFSYHPEDTENYFLNAEKNGIKQSVVLSFAYAADIRELEGQNIPRDEFIKQENDFVGKVQADRPNSVIGYCSVPWGYAKVVSEITRCAKDLKLKGIKLYPSNFYVEDGRYIGKTEVELASFKKDFEFLNQVIELAGTYNLDIGVHSSNLSAKNLLVYLFHTKLRYYPNVNTNFLHGFSMTAFESLSILAVYRKYAQRHNVFFELSESLIIYLEGHPLREKWIEMIRYAGVDRVLFASDYYRGGDSQQVNMMDEYKAIFSEKEFNVILNDNSNEFFKKKTSILKDNLKGVHSIPGLCDVHFHE